MTSDVQPRPVDPGRASVAIGARLFGLGSVFGKAIRDSRRATLLVGGILAVILLGVGTAIVTEFATPASRQELGDLIRAVPPILQGLAGRPVAVETLGGYMQYKYGTFFPLVASLWSILALSGTLAGEARRGSIEFVAATPVTRRAIAVQKLLGHIVAMVVAVMLIFVGLVVVGNTVAVLPGDHIPVQAAAGYAAWLGLLALAAGSIAFAVAPFLGRGAAIGIAGAVTFGGFILNGYQAAIPGLAPFARLTWFGWTSDHIPLAGLFDWPSLLLVLAVAIVLFVVGVEAFARRDLGATSAVPTPHLPRALVGVRGPISRAFGEQIPAALAWGIGLGLFGLLIAGSGRSFIEQLGSAPDFKRLLATAFPGIDIATVGGFLQLLFVEFGLILAGLAAATLVSSWASNETSGRLELLLATPLSRSRWAVAGGIAILLAVVVVTALAALGIAIGAAITGGDLVMPVAGTLVLGLFAVAMAGIGIAIGGVIGTSFAAPAVAVLTIVIWFADILAPALGLPAIVHDLALTAHYGQPMVGVWDPVGIVSSLALGVGGVLVGAWGFGRRDLRS